MSVRDPRDRFMLLLTIALLVMTGIGILASRYIDPVTVGWTMLGSILVSIFALRFFIIYHSQTRAPPPSRKIRTKTVDAMFDLHGPADRTEGAFQMTYMDRGREYEVIADVPSCPPEDIRVVVTPDWVEVELSLGAEGREVHFNSVTLPETIGPHGARAEIWGELLHVHVPKEPRPLHDGLGIEGMVGPRVEVRPVVKRRV